jgi:hypothetical protein
LAAPVYEAVEEAAAIERMAINSWMELAARFALENQEGWQRWRVEERRREREARRAASAAERRG